MASEGDNFGLSGPSHLSCVNWTDPHHTRSVAASLVRGVYILERDRQLKRQGPEALAPPWWEFFQFQLLRRLVDDVDSSIFGAIYEFKPPKLQCIESPRYVIAFRGTIRKVASLLRDLELDLAIFRGRLHEKSRFKIAIQEIRDVVSSVRESNVWLAGHSLGAALALLAGKTMAKSGTFIQSFIFNLPLSSLPTEGIKNNKVKHGIRIIKSVITAGLASVNKNHRSIDRFNALSDWYPCLFVHKEDILCAEYIGYFEHRKKMDEIGLGAIGRLATQNSLVGLVMSASGRESEPLHLIPSALLTVNLTPAQGFKEAHGISQWWRPDLQVQSTLYKYE